MGLVHFWIRVENRIGHDAINEIVDDVAMA